MSDSVWRIGKPPHIGWWNASILEDFSTWRWWNGVQWSQPCNIHLDAEMAAIASENKSNASEWISWNFIWPENARVPRIAP